MSMNQSANFGTCVSSVKIYGHQKHQEWNAQSNLRNVIIVHNNLNTIKWRRLRTQFAPSCLAKLGFGGLEHQGSNSFGVFSCLDFQPKVFRIGSENTEALNASVGGGNIGNKMPKLEEYSTNLTNLAEEGKLDPVAGWQEQIERLTEILVSHTKNNVCLVGESGVGKTAIVEGLARRIANGDVPETIRGKNVVRLEMGLHVAGTKSCVEFEEILKKLVVEIKRSKNIILFMDEVHTLIGACATEGGTDAKNILIQAIASGELQCIGATTLGKFREHIEKDPVLLRRFDLVKVHEPSVDESIQILKALRE